MSFWLGVFISVGITGIIVTPIFLWCLNRAYELGYRDKEKEDSKWLKVFKKQ